MTKPLALSLNKYKQYFPGIRICVIKNTFALIQAILIARTVNLNKLKDELPQVLANKSSGFHAHYTRLIRLFKYKKRKNLTRLLLKFNLKLLPLRSIKELALDRTQWVWGNQPINLLVLSYYYQNVAIPLCWIQLPKKGACSQKERIYLMEMASQLYSLKGATLLMDREFEGKTWLKYLHQKGIRFVLRLKKGVYKKMIKQHGTKRYSKLHHIAATGTRLGHTPVSLPYAKYQFVVMKNPAKCSDEPFLYFLSNLKGARQVPDKYLRRWKIEICFKHLKSNGFNLEEMHFKDLEKIELMMAMAVCAYCLAIQQGILQATKSPTPLKRSKARNKDYPRISIFRLGLTILKQKTHNLKTLLKHVQRVIFRRIKVLKIKSV